MFDLQRYKECRRATREIKKLEADRKIAYNRGLLNKAHKLYKQQCRLQEVLDGKNSSKP